MPLRVVLIGGVVLILAGLVAVLSHSGREQTGTNAVKRDAFVAIVPGGGTVCQADALPAKTGRLEMVIGTYGGPAPRLAATLREGFRVVSVGGRAPGWKEGVMTVPLRTVAPAATVATLCLRNGGRSRVAIAGQTGGPPAGIARVNGRPVGARISIRYQEPTDSSGWERLGTLATRVGDAKDVGSWVLWLAVVLVVLACGLATGVLWRAGGAGGNPT